MISAKQIGKNLQEIRKGLRPRIKQADFYKKYLKLVPGMPDQSTEAAAAKFMSQVENGDRQLPVQAFAIYSDLGGVSVDWILTGHEYHPAAACLDYSDALRLFAILSTFHAVEIAPDGSVDITDYALKKLLGAFQAARSDAAGLQSPERIGQWLSVVLDQLRGVRLDPEKAEKIEKFHAQLLDSYARQLRSGEKSELALLLQALAWSDQL